MTWRALGSVQQGDVLVGFDEEAQSDSYRKLRPATVEAVWWSRKPTRRLITEQSEVITTAEHRWLRHGSRNWPTTDRLRAGKPLRQVGVIPARPMTDEYRRGYIAGLSLGDGTFRYQPGQRSDKLGFPQPYWRVAMTDEEPLARLVHYLARFDIEAHIRPFCGGPGQRKPLEKVEVRALSKLGILHGLLYSEQDSDDYRRGFLGGFFDAEGNHGKSLRVFQNDVGILERVRSYGKRLGLEFRIESYQGQCPSARLTGPLRERLRFFATCQPAISRKTDALWHHTLETAPDPIVHVEAGPVADVVDLQTSTRTFLAAGLATHNCYAERMALRLEAMGMPRYRDGFALTLHEDLVELSTTWKKPRRAFVESWMVQGIDLVPQPVTNGVDLASLDLHAWGNTGIARKLADQARLLRLDSEIGKQPSTEKLGALTEDLKAILRLPVRVPSQVRRVVQLDRAGRQPLAEPFDQAAVGHRDADDGVDGTSSVGAHSRHKDAPFSVDQASQVGALLTTHCLDGIGSAADFTRCLEASVPGPVVIGFRGEAGLTVHHRSSTKEVRDSLSQILLTMARHGRNILPATPVQAVGRSAQVAARTRALWADLR
jgi:hypothetical protein